MPDRLQHWEESLLRSLTSVSDEDHLRETGDFSLVLGGPLFQLLLRAHLSDDALMLVRQRILFISLFAWLPLLVLAGLEGHLSGEQGPYPS